MAGGLGNRAEREKMSAEGLAWLLSPWLLA